mmetsp:Transcript_20875/g.43627  ORF Transcript_20875/g.43627 Transcript_20875/m.43627 type:complete len:122 (+) Transcript_20875:2428-2793(+)
MVSNQAYTGSLLFSCRNKQPTQTGKMSNFKPRFLSLVLELGKMGDTPPIKGSVKYIMRWGSHMQGVLCTSMMEWECHLTEKTHKMDAILQRLYCFSHCRTIPMGSKDPSLQSGDGDGSVCA